MSNRVFQLSSSFESIHIIFSFFNDNECLLPDLISNHVDLLEYANKLNSLGTTFIVKNHDEILGLITGYINNFETKNAYIKFLIVKKNNQNEGIGSLLYKAFFNKCKKDFGEGHIYLTVDKSNINACRIYRHYGFVNSDDQQLNSNKQNMVLEF